MKFKIFIFVTLLSLANFTIAEPVVTGARIKAPIPGQTMSAGYFEIVNTGADKVSIVGVQSNSASRIEMHTHEMENGMMSMAQLDTVEVEPGKRLSFIEGGHHLMIFDPDQKIVISGEFDLTFEFDDGTQLDVVASVEHFLKKTHKQ